jgi:hypothetical protein
VILASEFSDLHRSKNATECIKTSLDIMEYSGETDPQGKRLLFILHAFRDVVVNMRSEATKAAIANEGDMSPEYLELVLPQPKWGFFTGRISQCLTSCDTFEILARQVTC